eukprot:TRINITY_DN33962_c0_g1_i1.p1 TRINITY_DN33962_c0_g1~~TRINITY_DN33962_c0_g1_i1.p1  ORF type:complete len:135 (+),score=0.33 TRINITY_DN33962_c0_g1_i1:126-530(+)
MEASACTGMKILYNCPLVPEALTKIILKGGVGMFQVTSSSSDPVPGPCFIPRALQDTALPDSSSMSTSSTRVGRTSSRYISSPGASLFRAIGRVDILLLLNWKTFLNTIMKNAPMVMSGVPRIENLCHWLMMDD